MTVAIKEDGDDDDDWHRHITYAVTVANPSKAAKLAMRDSCARSQCSTVRSELECCKVDLEVGELVVVHDDDIDPITSRPGIISQRLIFHLTASDWIPVRKLHEQLAGAL
ncbi:hypothetical protein HAP48_0026500 [Bradyrhizobium septentrionale]|uniref:Uncharacterized protein n=1 Tax=Bradyrhizobium septentrionale TaxID=1404411 RepID=A0A973ZYP8_9BRAD|nr:hypothetical protein [Bradyrhizobium septentrionale]UGY12270.1 hypothetical protein HAP48_0026500 [Bradyrhizobium septentrionale]UGY25614.1 hypothetical protein HU675_0001625 [Bradyrhizobium septentrionale]